MDILHRLELKHAEDVFVPECKNGPTHTTDRMLRMDAWAMAKSWTNPRVTVYEIKTSRSDFVNDAKAHLYLPYCNQLYFVCPSKLIQPDEVPEKCGLMWAPEAGTRLLTKKKSAYRDAPVDPQVFRYILMCRAQISRETAQPETAQDFYRKWMEEKEENRKFGRHVGRSLYEKYKKDVLAIAKENERLAEKMQAYDEVKQLLAAMGIEPGKYMSSWAVRQKLEARPELVEILGGAARTLEHEAQMIKTALAAWEKKESKDGASA